MTQCAAGGCAASNRCRQPGRCRLHRKLLIGGIPSSTSCSKQYCGALTFAACVACAWSCCQATSAASPVHTLSMLLINSCAPCLNSRSSSWGACSSSGTATCSCRKIGPASHASTVKATLTPVVATPSCRETHTGVGETAAQEVKHTHEYVPENKSEARGPHMFACPACWLCNAPGPHPTQPEFLKAPMSCAFDL